MEKMLNLENFYQKKINEHKEIKAKRTRHIFLNEF